MRRLPLGGTVPLPGKGLHIGAGVPDSDLAADPAVRHGYPVLSKALLSGASGRLRNLATTGGNLLPLLAVLGTSEHCAAALCAPDARGGGGRRRIPVTDLPFLPGKHAAPGDRALSRGGQPYSAMTSRAASSSALLACANPSNTSGSA
ncbi:FAD binding domain-containing protein [Nocardiopsis suaedae]|uniref:FAD binding domain-containing protein n=1 Tax=Nocardiopsis suaedae TaxID=3018444 RepID=UPI0022E5689B|nr:FAD binding domain-containing protein [Nocardiopsis suaedae]